MTLRQKNQDRRPDDAPTHRSSRLNCPKDADVRFPPVISPIGCDNESIMLEDFEHRYRAVRGRRPLRRMVLRSCYLYGDLLSAQLSCRDAQAIQRPFLSDRGRRTVRRFSRLQAVRARRRARFARMGH